MKYRKCLDSIPEYIPGQRIKGLVKLSSNENLLGPSPKATRAIRATLKDAHFYPDGHSSGLKKALAKLYGLTEQNLIIGNGSDEVFHFACAAFMQPSENAVIADPTFSEYAFSTKLFDGEILKVPLIEGSWNLSSVLSVITASTRIVFLCNPNNPTGTYFSHSDLESFLEKTDPGILVILDEAYCHYADATDYPDSLSLLSKYANLIISRTFSKAYGLAGLRIGWAAACPEIIQIMNKTKGPFNNNILAQAAAEAALSDKKFLNKVKKINTEGKRFLYTELDALSLPYYKTQANFICIKLPFAAKEAAEKFKTSGLTIRPLDSFGMPSWIRVTISLKKYNHLFIEALKKILD